GLWLHVDACYGAAASLLPEFAERRAALARADSISLDAHKWLFMPLTAGLVLTRHPEVAARAFDDDASYIPGREMEAWQRGIPTSRRAAGLMVWAGLRAHGFRPIREAVGRNIRQARLAERLLQGGGFQVLEGGELSVACARWTPAGLGSEATDALQEGIAERVADSGGAWFSTVWHLGKTWLRLNFVNLYTRDEHVVRLVKLIQNAAIDAGCTGEQISTVSNALHDVAGERLHAPRPSPAGTAVSDSPPSFAAPSAQAISSRPDL
ncbi:MAG TPA: pyridoxal-dependent decarboxylase, partial [Myxococcaceae bacterium]|nr:pyridoxal-dependent decarboxylase [Myxococcaceae bacterium]